ncbi:glycosyltransferase [bacterium]|nr:glycosyltransferase [bacterium]
MNLKNGAPRNLGFRPQVEVSAIVSTYAAEKYMAGCLEDLMAQSLYQEGRCEIIVVDCNSPEDEQRIIREYQERHPRITSVRITERETLAGAWNIGAKYAEGEFVTNANTDDRHHPRAFEKMAQVLRENKDVDLVYGDVFQSLTPNEPFEENSQTVLYRYKPYFAPEVLFNYQFGCQPMWRASLHDKMGYFNREFKAASDYEFNFRFALAGCRARHIQEPLGLFLERTDSLSQGDKTSTDEQGALRSRYVTPENILALYRHEGWSVETPDEQLRAFHDLSLRAMDFEFPWHPHRRYKDPEVSLVAVTAGLQLQESHPVLLNNLAVICHLIGNIEQSQQLFQQLQSVPVPEPVQKNIQMLQSGNGEAQFELCAAL